MRYVFLPFWVLFFVFNPGSVYGLIEITYVKNCTAVGVSDGAVEAAATGNAGPFKFTWSNGVVATDVNISNIKGLSAGAYYVTVTTATGCDFVLTANVGVCFGSN